MGSPAAGTEPLAFPRHALGYYALGQGFKVAVEAALMAADQGALPLKKEALALGGSASGADTALILAPVCSSAFFDLRIREVVCMPRSG